MVGHCLVVHRMNDEDGMLPASQHSFGVEVFCRVHELGEDPGKWHMLPADRDERAESVAQSQLKL